MYIYSANSRFSRSLKILKILKDVQKCQQRLPCLRSGEIFCRRLRARPGHGGLFCGRPWPGDQHGLQKNESAEVHQRGMEICWNQVLSGLNSVAPVAMVFFNRSLKGCLLCGMCASAPALLTHESACSEILARSCSLFTRVGQPRKAHIARHDEPTTGFASLEIQQFDSIMLYHHLGQSSLALRSKQASNPNVCQLSQLRYFCHLVPVVSGVGSAKLSIQHPKAVAFAWLGALLCQGWKLKGMVQKVWVCLKIGYPWLPQNPNGHHFPY